MEITDKRLLLTKESTSSKNTRIAAGVGGGLIGALIADGVTKGPKPYLEIPLSAITDCGLRDKKEFFIWSYVAPWNKLYKRTFIEENQLKFDEIFSTNDRTFYFSSLVKSKKIVTMDASLINYRINNATSLTGTYNESKFNNRKLAYQSSDPPCRI